MEIEIKIEQDRKETKVIILTQKIDASINQIIEKIKKQEVDFLIGFQEERATLLEPQNIYRIYALNQKVYAITQKETYQIRLRLYELETLLDEEKFIRISHSEIINLKKVDSFDLSLSGTICTLLKNGDKTYVSRRNVKKIKKALGLGGLKNDD